MTKPRRKEFELSKIGLRHIPTDATFVPYPKNPTSGNWRGGELGKKLKSGAQYDPDEVKEMGRRLWDEYLIAASD